MHLNRCSHLLCYLVLCCWTFSSSASPSRCKLRKYVHKAQQTDMNGRRCWDEVKLSSCQGHCLSHEISDWQFPYKISHHPVCSHGERSHSSVILKNCDPNVQPGTEKYHFVQATSCKCQACSSEDTSCEWLPTDSSPLGNLIIKEEMIEQDTE